MNKVFKTEDLMGCFIDELKGLIKLRAKLKLKGSNEEIELSGMEKVESAISRLLLMVILVMS